MSKVYEQASYALGALALSPGDLRERVKNAMKNLFQIRSLRLTDSLSPEERDAFSTIGAATWNRNLKAELDPQRGKLEQSIDELSEDELVALGRTIIAFHRAALQRHFWDRPRDPRDSMSQDA